MKKMILILSFLVFSTGCIAPFIAPLASPLVSGVIMWVDGEAHKYYGHDAETIHRCLKRACQELNYEISSDKPKNGGYSVIAGGKDRFNISIRHVEDGITELSIRVNFMGDKPYAELLYKKIDETLATIEFDPDGNPTRFNDNRTQYDF